MFTAGIAAKQNYTDQDIVDFLTNNEYVNSDIPLLDRLGCCKAACMKNGL